MTFLEYLNSLSDNELDDYAKKCKTSKGYLVIHLKHRRKIPREKLLESLWQQSNGKINKEAVLEHFYGRIKAN